MDGCTGRVQTVYSRPPMSSSFEQLGLGLDRLKAELAQERQERGLLALKYEQQAAALLAARHPGPPPPPPRA